MYKEKPNSATSIYYYTPVPNPFYLHEDKDMEVCKLLKSLSPQPETVFSHLFDSGSHYSYTPKHIFAGMKARNRVFFK